MKKFVIPIFLVGSLLMIYVMTKTGATLKTSATPLGILDLEFAYNTAKTTAVINAWIPSDNITAAKLNTWLDFLFLFFYAPFLFFAAKKIAQTNNSKVGSLIARGALWAGFLDIFENAGMLLTLHNYTSGYIAFFTTFFSVIKWALALIAVLYVVTGALILAYRKIKKRPGVT